MKPIRQFQADQLQVRIYENRQALGSAAASDGIALLDALLQKQAEVRVIFAAAPSQNELLAALCTATHLDWGRVTAFHMDEYIGLPPDAPQGFGNFLRTRLFNVLPFGNVFYLSGSTDAAEACARYGRLLSQAPIDIVFMGIGENGHIAFNDPPVADFRDPLLVKQVALDDTCRMQQVHDGCFASMDQVPTHALTLTVPALANAAHHLCVVPASTKAAAVKATLQEPLSAACPATVLRTCPDAVLYLDRDSARLL